MCWHTLKLVHFHQGVCVWERERVQHFWASERLSFTVAMQLLFLEAHWDALSHLNENVALMRERYSSALGLNGLQAV